MDADRIAGALDGNVSAIDLDGRVVLLIEQSAAIYLPTGCHASSPLTPSDSTRAGLLGLIDTTPLATGHADARDLLWWASRRQPRSEWGPGGDDSAFDVSRPSYDAQPCLGAPINRALLREVLQVLVETGDPARIDVELTERNGGPMFTFRSGDTVACIMGMANRDGTLLLGADPAPLLAP